MCVKKGSSRIDVVSKLSNKQKKFSKYNFEICFFPNKNYPGNGKLE